MIANLVSGLSNIDISRRELIDTDGYVRYARILDLVHGRNGWFDGWIHWSNSPFGHSMHWTRPLDALVIALAAPLAPFAGWEDAVYWTALISGPLLHMALIAVVIWSIRPFVPRQAAALAGWIAALQPLVVDYSSLGRLDHHVLIAILTMALFGYTLRALEGDPRAATAAGCFAGLALWVSTEARLPIGLTLAALMMWWVISGGPLNVLWRYSAAFALTVVGSLFLERGPHDLMAIENDRIALPYLITAVICVIGVTVAVIVGRLHPSLFSFIAKRILVLVSSVLIPLIAVVLKYPNLRKQPFAPQRIWDIHLSHVQELQPVWALPSPVGSLVIYIGTPILGLFCSLILVRRSHRRVLWSAIAVWLVVLIPLAASSVRLAMYPEALAALPVAAAAWPVLCSLRNGFLARKVLTRISLILMVVMGNRVVGVAAAAFSEGPSDHVAPLYCQVGKLAPLIERNVPGDAAILAHIDLGPVIHVTTDRNVIATPHHRNVDGILAAYDIMRSTPDIARSAIEQRQIGAIVVCSRQDRPYLDPIPPQSLAHALIDGSPPSWLTKVTSDDSEATLYLVRP